MFLLNVFRMFAFLQISLIAFASNRILSLQLTASSRLLLQLTGASQWLIVCLFADSLLAMYRATRLHSQTQQLSYSMCQSYLKIILHVVDYAFLMQGFAQPKRRSVLDGQVQQR